MIYRCTQHTGINKLVFSTETTHGELAVRVETDDEDVAHGHEQVRPLIRVTATVTSVKVYIEQVLIQWLDVSEDVHIVVDTPVHSPATSVGMFFVEVKERTVMWTSTRNTTWLNDFHRLPGRNTLDVEVVEAHQHPLSGQPLEAVDTPMVVWVVVGKSRGCKVATSVGGWARVNWLVTLYTQIHRTTLLSVSTPLS